jgi:hypothetical protein
VQLWVRKWKENCWRYNQEELEESTYTWHLNASHLNPIIISYVLLCIGGCWVVAQWCSSCHV